MLGTVALVLLVAVGFAGLLFGFAARYDSYAARLAGHNLGAGAGVAIPRLRRALLALGVFVASSCGQVEPASSDVGRACELLSTKTEVALPPPATGSATMGIGETITDGRPGPAFDASVYLHPNRSSEVDDVAEAVRELGGVEVVAVLDQNDVYDEFVLLFADSEQLIKSVSPEILPAAVRVTVASDGEFEALDAALRGDARIYEIVDEYGLRAGSIKRIAQRFSSELEELEDITNGELREAIVVIRSGDGPTRQELPGAAAVVRDFLERECDVPG